MSKKIKCSVEVWSDTFTDKRKIKFVVSTKEEFNFDTRKQSKESGGENAELMKDLDKACWTKNLGTHAQVLNGIHHGVLGKSGAKYLKDTRQSQPLNDKLPVKTLATKNIAIIMSTVAIQEDKREELTGAQGKSIGVRCGSYAKFISENTEVKAMFEAHFEQERRKARSR